MVTCLLVVVPSCLQFSPHTNSPSLEVFEAAHNKLSKFALAAHSAIQHINIGQYSSESAWLTIHVIREYHEDS